MIKLLNTADLSHISHLQEEVQTYALEALSILDEEYGMVLIETSSQTLEAISPS